MVNRYTLAGLLAVLGVAGVGALAVWLFNGAPLPEQTPVAQEQSTPAPAASATPTPSPAKPPKQRTKNLAAAARLAGCRLINPPDQGREHVTRPVTAADYDTNPPTSGIHAPEWASDMVYPPGNTPDLGTLVHTLEHGRINIQYRAGTDGTTITQLTALVHELADGYHLLLYENATEMPWAIAVTAWDHLLGCSTMNDRVFDAIRAFRIAYIDKGPEVVP